MTTNEKIQTLTLIFPAQKTRWRFAGHSSLIRNIRVELGRFTAGPLEASPSYVWDKQPVNVPHGLIPRHHYGKPVAIIRLSDPYTPGAAPHKLCKVLSLRVEAGTVEIVVEDLAVPHFWQLKDNKNLVQKLVHGDSGQHLQFLFSKLAFHWHIPVSFKVL